MTDIFKKEPQSISASQHLSLWEEGGKRCSKTQWPHENNEVPAIYKNQFLLTPSFCQHSELWETEFLHTASPIWYSTTAALPAKLGPNLNTIKSSRKPKETKERTTHTETVYSATGYKGWICDVSMKNGQMRQKCEAKGRLKRTQNHEHHGSCRLTFT